MAFNPNGTLNFIEQPNGDTLTAGIHRQPPDEPHRLLHRGKTIYAYNAQGLISQITDPQGRFTLLTY